MFGLPIPTKLVRNVLNSAPALSSLAMPPQVSLGLKVASQLGIIGGGNSNPLGAIQTVAGAAGVTVPPFLTENRVKILTTVFNPSATSDLDPIEVINSIGWLKG